MTETQWQNCVDPDQMLAYLRDKASGRKLRLFVCACRRRVWDLLDDRSQAETEAAEKEIDIAPPTTAVWMSTQAEASGLATMAAQAAQGNGGEAAAKSAWDEQRRGQCGLLRDVFNPFRPAKVEKEWLTANGGTAGKMAQEIYEKANFERLPELAEALMDADCQDDRLLAHCHAAKGHARGCWVLDALLGKE
jgi:hypothetical protein